jgi:16S rRNA (guanine966-N2)-methyltransferase
MEIRTSMAKHAKKSQPGRLRIVAGIWRSRLLDIADVEGLRPTSERIRETLFNWLTMRIIGARCLDLCAGTGALGLEALSRGASESVFVEKSPVAATALRQNVVALETDKAMVLQADALQYLRSAQCGQFDIVFLDPPFAADMLEDLCRLLESEAVLTAGARVYLEQDRAGTEPNLPEGWEILKTKCAGNVRYSLLKPGTGGVTK